MAYVYHYSLFNVLEPGKTQHTDGVLRRESPIDTPQEMALARKNIEEYHGFKNCTITSLTFLHKTRKTWPPASPSKGSE